MSSSPNHFSTGLRCNFCRLHRNIDSPPRPCFCETLQSLTQSELFCAIATPAATRRRAARVPRLIRQRSNNPEPDNDSSAFLASSPAHRRSTDAGSTLATATGLLTPLPSREPASPSTTAVDDPDNIVVLQSDRNTPVHTPEPEQMPSPASTQIVLETPRVQLHIHGRDDHDAGFHTSPTEREIDVESLDTVQLRRVFNQLTTELENSTAQVDRLITQSQIYAADKLAKETYDVQTQLELVQARIDAVEAEQTRIRSSKRYGTALAILCTLVVVHVFWCGWNRANFTYAEKRRWEAFA